MSKNHTTHASSLTQDNHWIERGFSLFERVSGQ